jgi:Sec-independent protein translocase protein TatA
MSFILFIIFFLVILPYVVPAILRWLATAMIKRKTREMNDAFARAAGIDPDELRRQQAQQAKTRKKGGWTEPTQQRRKKIDSEVGEYVKFQDVADDASASSSDTNTQKTTSGASTSESQIEDVTWEDV